MRYYALMLVALLTGCGSEEVTETKEVAKAVKTITLNQATNQNSLTFPGKVIAGKQADITFKVSGKLNMLPVKEGQLVKKGDVIAKLDQRDFSLAYDKQKAALNENKAAFARAQELIKNRYISQADFDNKKKSYEIAKADTNIAKTNLNYTVLKAPFDGEIAEVHVDNYQNVQVKEQIVTLQNLDFLEIKINVPERLVINTNMVKKIDVAVRFDANKKNTYTANITEISTQADPTTQTYKATVRLPRPEDLNVLPGMTAVVEVTATLNEKVYSKFKIPADSIFSDSNQNTFVWVVGAQNRIIKTPIKASSFNENTVEVTEGLNPNDKIVIAGVNFLREDQLVKIYN